MNELYGKETLLFFFGNGYLTPAPSPKGEGVRITYHEFFFQPNIA